MRAMHFLPLQGLRQWARGGFFSAPSGNVFRAFYSCYKISSFLRPCLLGYSHFLGIKRPFGWLLHFGGPE